MTGCNGAVGNSPEEFTYDQNELVSRWVIDAEQEPPEAETKWWLHAKAVTFPEFFNKNTDDLLSLELVPMPEAGNHGACVAYYHSEDAQVMRDLYRKHGWPQAFPREEFRQAAAPDRLAAIRKMFPRSESDPEELEALENEILESQRQ
ncbi:uncharacterized protein LY79DRAFT_580860 [Colletotrichum navitas]|uniref:Uncharacterized protein n=1 Tax=Colletotrichum navitas TaxID=681940 RepID=A0AAD8PVT9_9PEZI|nr:uncharacterized protein LY79DRAFT_580860 [Colletotrichum navitas]KAK1585617.1 hypothetical protein LY79DRAFT_580860 [Colletotrichum navitas]